MITPRTTHNMISTKNDSTKGRAYLVEQDWVVEDSLGDIRLVIGGELGSYHRLLCRGRDENRMVRFIPFESYCDVVELLQNE